MPNTYTPNNALTLQAFNENPSTWGSISNDVFNMIDAALDGIESVDVSGSSPNATLTIADGAPSQARSRVLNFTGARTVTNITVTVGPNTAKKNYWVRNSTTGGFSVIIAQGSGSTVTIAPGSWALVFLDGIGAAANVTTLTSFSLAGSSSGITIIQPSAAASGTLTLPAATDTLVGRATTDTLTNKTYDTAGAGNVLRINGNQVSSVTGTGAVVLSSSPTISGTVTASGTLLTYDSTPTTGVSQAIVRGGPGQSATNLMEWRNSANSVLSAVSSSGSLGVGIGTPTRKVTVYESNGGASDVAVRVQHVTSNPAYLEIITTQGTAIIGMGPVSGPGFTANLQITSTGGIHLMPAGSMGVNTVNPQFPVDINQQSTRIGTTGIAAYLQLGANATDTNNFLIGNESGSLVLYQGRLGGTVSERARIDTSGNLKVGGTADRATTAGTNQVVIFNGTAPVGTLTNGCSFYSTAGEMRVMDAAGNATLLSPHDSVSNEWIYDSTHTPTGKRLRIDVEKLLRFLNDHFGLDCIQEFIEP